MDLQSKEKAIFQMKARCEARLSYFRVNSCIASQLHALAAWNLQAKPPLVNRLPRGRSWDSE
jgi:hypothetical protein